MKWGSCHSHDQLGLVFQNFGSIFPLEVFILPSHMFLLMIICGNSGVTPVSPLGAWSHAPGDGPAVGGSPAALGEPNVLPCNNPLEAWVLPVLTRVTWDLRRWFIFPGEID